MTMSRWGTKALLENDFASSLNKLGIVGLAKKRAIKSTLHSEKQGCGTKEAKWSTAGD